MTHQELIDNGYRRCAGDGPWSGADCSFQKCIRSQDRRWRLYYINVGMWDFRKYQADAHVGWEAEAHFYRGEDRTFRLHIPVRDVETIHDIEADFADFYRVMNCVPDRYNQD